MKKYKNMDEYRKATRKRSLESYHRMREDPERYEKYKAKRRVYDRKRYRKMMDDLKATE